MIGKPKTSIDTQEKARKCELFRYRKMVSDTILPATALLAALLAATSAFAARPLTTDDAAILDDKQCQIEAWVDRGRDASVGWFVPSCNFGGGVEWQIGLSRAREQ